MRLHHIAHPTKMPIRGFPSDRVVLPHRPEGTPLNRANLHPNAASHPNHLDTVRAGKSIPHFLHRLPSTILEVVPDDPNRPIALRSPGIPCGVHLAYTPCVCLRLNR